LHTANQLDSNQSKQLEKPQETVEKLTGNQSWLNSRRVAMQRMQKHNETRVEQLIT